MPTVPYGQRKVATAALPGVRKRAAATADSEGAGLARAQGAAAAIRSGAAEDEAAAKANVGGQVANIGINLAGQLAQAERDRADDVALMAAKNKLARWETDRLYNPETGALAQKGKSALPLPEQMDTEFSTVTGDIEKELNPRQREKFLAIKGQAGVSLHATVQRHVFGQMQAYESEELQARVENGQSLAVANALDPRRVGEVLADVVADVKKSAPRLGLGPEQVQAQVEKITSATHVGVIDRLLTSGNDRAAKVYFEETRGQIAGDAMAKVEKALEEGALRGDSQKRADAILAAGGTLAEQRAQARQIDDPKLRDAVNERIEHEAVVRDRETREAEEATLTSAYNVVDRSHDVSAIAPGVWANLPGSARSALRGYAEHLAKGTPVETDLPTYYALMEQASSDPATFTNQNLLNYRHKLDDTEFKQLAGLQNSVRTGQRTEAAKALEDYRTETGVVNDALQLAGIEPTPGDKDQDGKARVARFRGLVADEARRVASITGKKPTVADVSAIANRLLARQITEHGWFSDRTRSIGTATITDVPPAERKQIEAALAGQSYDDNAIIALWLRREARKAQ